MDEGGRCRRKIGIDREIRRNSVIKHGTLRCIGVIYFMGPIASVSGCTGFYWVSLAPKKLVVFMRGEEKKSVATLRSLDAVTTGPMDDFFFTTFFVLFLSFQGFFKKKKQKKKKKRPLFSFFFSFWWNDAANGIPSPISLTTNIRNGLLISLQVSFLFQVFCDIEMFFFYSKFSPLLKHSFSRKKTGNFVSPHLIIN